MIIALTLLILFTVALATTPRVRYPNAKRVEAPKNEWLQTRPRGKYHSFKPGFQQSDCGRVFLWESENAVALEAATSVVSAIRDDRKVSDLILVGGATDKMCKNCIRVGAN